MSSKLVQHDPEAVDVRQPANSGTAIQLVFHAEEALAPAAQDIPADSLHAKTFKRLSRTRLQEALCPVSPLGLRRTCIQRRDKQPIRVNFRCFGVCRSVPSPDMPATSLMEIPLPGFLKRDSLSVFRASNTVAISKNCDPGFPEGSKYGLPHTMAQTIARLPRVVA